MMEKRGKGNMKRKKGLLSRMATHYMRYIMMSIVIIGLSATLLYKRSIYAASDRAKTAAAVIVGGGAVGGLASIGGGKWFPLGFVGGGLAAGLIARSIIKRHRAERATNGAPYEPSYRSRRRRSRANNMMNGESMPTQTPYTYTNGNGNY